MKSFRTSDGDGRIGRVDELGIVRLRPPLGNIKVAGMTPSALEKELADILVRAQQLKEPVVSVQVPDARARTYTLIGEGSFASGTNVGIYAIPYPDFRIMDAVAQAHGVGGQVKTLYVIRGVQLDKYPTATTAPAGGEEPTKPVPPANPADLIQDLMKGLEPGPAGNLPPIRAQRPTRARRDPKAPQPLQTGLEPPEPVRRNGSTSRANGSMPISRSAAVPTTQAAATTQPATVTQRRHRGPLRPADGRRPAV